MMWHLHENQIPVSICFIGTQSHLFLTLSVAIYLLQWQNETIAAKIIYMVHET